MPPDQQQLRTTSGGRAWQKRRLPCRSRAGDDHSLRVPGGDLQLSFVRPAICEPDQGKLRVAKATLEGTDTAVSYSYNADGTLADVKRTSGSQVALRQVPPERYRSISARHP